MVKKLNVKKIIVILVHHVDIDAEERAEIVFEWHIQPSPSDDPKAVTIQGYKELHEAWNDKRVGIVVEERSQKNNIRDVV